MRKWSGVIPGQCYSKANQKRPCLHNGQPRIRKSLTACNYKEACRTLLAFNRARPLLKGRLKATVIVYYRTLHSDLDVETFFDAMQGFVYANDNQIWEKHLIRRIDKDNPRVEVVVEEIGPECEREADRLIEWVTDLRS
jgi:Holliday junction resolvase RusA-like endonuclease